MSTAVRRAEGVKRSRKRIPRAPRARICVFARISDLPATKFSSTLYTFIVAHLSPHYAVHIVMSTA
jgi:hypothetical protein